MKESIMKENLWIVNAKHTSHRAQFFRCAFIILCYPFWKVSASSIYLILQARLSKIYFQNNTCFTSAYVIEFVFYFVFNLKREKTIRFDFTCLLAFRPGIIWLFSGTQEKPVSIRLFRLKLVAYFSKKMHWIVVFNCALDH